MKTEYDTDTAFLYPITGKTGTPLYIPSCYAIEAKRDLLQAVLRVCFCRR